jgi:ubiquitin thioesterase OTU1
MAVRLRFRLPATGQSHNVTVKEPSLLLGQVITEQLETLVSAPADSMKLRLGAPPHTILDPKLPVDAQLRSGDTVLLDIPSTANQASQVTTPSPIKSYNPVMLKRPIPDDNSCLFNAVGYVAMQRDRTQALSLRQVIAQTVMSSPDKYPPEVLGRPSAQDYCQIMMQPHTWGGAIELRIFSDYFRLEIVSIDVETGRAYRFGEDQNYEQRVFVLYSGIHYDAIVKNPFGVDGPSGEDVTVFSTTDDVAFTEALDVAAKERANHNYTNTNNFTLKCGQCGYILVGQSEAQKHATLTGHTDFKEFE